MARTSEIAVDAMATCTLIPKFLRTASSSNACRYQSSVKPSQRNSCGSLFTENTRTSRIGA